MRVLESGKYPKQNQECERKKAREDAPLQAPRLPENLAITERPEPQQVNPVGEHGAAAENDHGNDCDDKNNPRRLRRGGEVSLGQSIVSGISTPLFLFLRFQNSIRLSQAIQLHSIPLFTSVCVPLPHTPPHIPAPAAPSCSSAPCRSASAASSPLCPRTPPARGQSPPAALGAQALELEACPGSLLRVPLLDGVVQPAGRAHHGHRAVLERINLVQPAGLVDAKASETCPPRPQSCAPARRRSRICTATFAVCQKAQSRKNLS